MTEKIESRLDYLKARLENARKIVLEIENIQSKINKADEDEKSLFNHFLERAKDRLKIISSEMPGLLSEESLRKGKGFVFLTEEEKKKYLKELQLEQDLLKFAIKKVEKREKESRIEIAARKEQAFKKAGKFVTMSSRLFSKISLNLSKMESFKKLDASLRKANMPYLVSTYISVSLFSALIATAISAIALPFLFMAFGTYSLLVLLLPLLTFIVVLFYPLSEATSTRIKIEDELPFAVMHMAAIAGSGVDPSRVFSILASSNEYPAIKKEMRKLVNQINFYGLDMTAALKSTAKTTPSQRLAELLNGMSTTISGGGDLSNYLTKIAEDTMLDYKLRRKKFTVVSETYADIYTGLLIAAPLMFMLMLVLLNVLGGSFGGMSTMTIAWLGIGAIILLNIGFLIFLKISQPQG